MFVRCIYFSSLLHYSPFAPFSSEAKGELNSPQTLLQLNTEPIHYGDAAVMLLWYEKECTAVKNRWTALFVCFFLRVSMASYCEQS